MPRLPFPTRPFEESETGTMNLLSSDLGLGHETTHQIVGIRFQNVVVPKGALISCWALLIWRIGFTFRRQEQWLFFNPKQLSTALILMLVSTPPII